MRSAKRRNCRRQRRLTVELLEHRWVLSSGYGEAFALFTDETLQVPGLVASYVNESLRAVDELVWRVTRAIAGTRVDPVLFFPTPSLGARSEVGISGGSDADWDSLSVQWDGVVDTPPSTKKTYTLSPAQPGTRIVTARITDPHGAQAAASPLALRVDPANGGEAHGEPVIRLSKDQGYAAVVQSGVPLEAGTTYVFSCHVRGAFRAGLHDHIAELSNTEGHEPVYAEAQYEALDGWTIFRRAITPTVTRDYRVALAFWDTAVFEATDFALRESPGGANLLRNGDLAAGLQDWESDGGQIELVRVPAENNWMPAPGQLVPYRRFDDQIEMLRAYQGREVMLLVPDNGVFAADPQVVGKILHRLDESWDYFVRTTGQRPGIYGNRVNLGGQTHLIGLPTLAVVEQTCGAGCGFVGATGIEIARDFWKETYDNAVAGEETRGLFEYEMGRNFWLFGHLLESAEVPTYHLGTAFATIYGYQAGVAAGSTEQPGNELVDWVQTYRDGFASYLAAPDWGLVRDGSITGERIHGGLWLYLAEQYGEDWHGRFFRHAAQLDGATTLADAISNYIVASSAAAGTNLYTFFAASLNFPEVAGLKDRVDQVLAAASDETSAADDHFKVFNDFRSAPLDVLANDDPGPQGVLPPMVVAADGADQGGTLHVDLGGRRVVYTPPAGFYGVETFAYTIGDAYGEVSTATVTVEVVKRWHNPVHAGDVNADHLVSPADVLDVINALNGGLPARLPDMPSGSVARLPFVDVTDDGEATALDVLSVINLLNRAPGGAVVIADDGREPNDAPGEARELGTLWQTTVIAGLQLRDSADWYQFTLPRKGTWQDAAVIAFPQVAGDLELVLHDSAGRELDRSDGIADSESVSLSDLEAGTYLLGVFGHGLAGTEYGLTIFLPA